MKMLSTGNKNFHRGLTLVEVLVAASIILVFTVSLVGVYNLYLRIVFANSYTVKAAFLAEEGLEVMRFFRDVSWENNILTLSKDTDYGLTFDNLSNVWMATTSIIFIDDQFERRITVSDVYRDASSQIVTSGGSIDPDTIKITSVVSWKRGSATTTKSISTYLTNIYDN